MKGYEKCMKYIELDEPICGLCLEGYSLNANNECDKD